MTKPHYKPTWLMGILLVALTFTTLPVQAGGLTNFFMGIGKQLLQDVVVEYGKQMIQDNLTKDADGHTAKSNPKQLDATQQAQIALQAAKQGDAKAQFAMAAISYEGWGVPKNEEQAFEWMTKSANQGFVDAQFGLGLMYESGIGVRIDNEQAVEWYQKAADQGFARAQFNLGTMYSSGLGVERNPILAYQWFFLAASQGDEHAQQEQTSLRQQLSLPEVNEANRLAKHWLAEHNGRVARSESPKTRLPKASEDSEELADSSASPPTELLPAIQITEREATRSGQLIWMNESSGKTSGLVTWNKGENWASLGIGHFIWYPEGQGGRFTETFPDLVSFLQGQGVTIPQWLQNTPYCPWPNRQKFLEDSNSSEQHSLRTLMEQTIPQQIQFLIKRWQRALPKMLKTLPNTSQRHQIREQFYRVAQAPKGVYVLIDYLNFKGEGTSPKERYQGQGWGLLQVLEEMSGDSTEDATKEFANAAETVLNRRVQNAPAEKNEACFLKGWKKRLDTYR